MVVVVDIAKLHLKKCIVAHLCYVDISTPGCVSRQLSRDDYRARVCQLPAFERTGAQHSYMHARTRFAHAASQPIDVQK